MCISFLNGIWVDRTFILYILGGEQKQYFLHSYVFIFTIICFFLAYPQKMLMLKPTIDGEGHSDVLPTQKVVYNYHLYIYIYIYPHIHHITHKLTIHNWGMLWIFHVWGVEKVWLGYVLLQVPCGSPIPGIFWMERGLSVACSLNINPSILPSLTRNLCKNKITFNLTIKKLQHMQEMSTVVIVLILPISIKYIIN